MALIQSSRDQDRDVENSRKLESATPKENLSILERLEHFTWANYTYPMATGGLALLLSPGSQPHTFPGLDDIGKVVYVYDLVIFTIVTAAIIFRFTRFPVTFKASLTHPTEALFFGTFCLSLASIIACIARYGIPSCGPWLVTTYNVLFWIYFAGTFGVAVGQYCLLFTNPRLKIQDMTPAWDLPIFPFMLCGTLAAVGASLQPRDQAVPMLVAGLTAQGLGMLVSVLMYASYLRRMIQYGFPSPSSRPAMFIAVGPPSFTSLAIIGMANTFPPGHAYWGNDEVTSQVLRILATMTAVFLWGLSLWFFFIAVVSCLAVWRELTFHLNWWAFVFPNVGFTVAIINIGREFKSEGMLWLGSVMTVLLVILYLFVLVNQARAIWTKTILWPGKDEDVYIKESNGKANKTGHLDHFENKAD